MKKLTSALFKLLPWLVALVVFSSCSTMISGKYQTITIEPDCKGIPTTAICTLRNEHGVWTTHAPNALVIQKGFGDLVIDCSGAGFSRHTAYIPSKSELSNYGNILSLGTLSIVDVQNGAGYRYPEHYRFSVNQCIPYRK